MPFWKRLPCRYDSRRLCTSSDYNPQTGHYTCNPVRCPILDKHQKREYNNSISKNESENTNEDFGESN